MSNSDVNKNSFTNLQMIFLLCVSIFLVILLFIFRGGISTNSSLEKLARSSLPLNEALSSGKPTIVEFYAEWCEACNEMASSMTNLKEITHNQLNIVLLNVDNPAWSYLIDKYEVNGIPHINFFDSKGDPKGFSVGIKNESQLIEISDALINGKELPEFLSTAKKTDLSNSYFSDKSYPYQNSFIAKPRSHG